MDDFALADKAIEWIALWKEVYLIETGTRIEFGDACQAYFKMMERREEEIS